MPIYIGTSIKNQQQISLGSTQIQKVYIGDKLVWGKLTGLPPVILGLLYNWFAITDSRKITSSDDWRVMTTNDAGITLKNAIGGNLSMFYKLMETGILYWPSPNTIATNQYGYNLRANGWRSNTGAYGNYHTAAFLWTTDVYLTNGMCWTCNSSGAGQTAQYAKQYGFGARLRRVTTTLAEGAKGTYTGNNGRIYDTVVIGGVEYVSENLFETQFRNGDWIHGFEGGTYTPISNAAWAALTTEGCCAYADDISNI